MQQRLEALGFATKGDEPGAFDASTHAAVAAFQERRGLRIDGICGAHTWSALVEAGYRLGDRPLYLTHPMLRGDDVAELQRRLGALGFDAGRVDGIFGSRTDRALADFQRNDGLVTDSICGPATIAALGRLGSSCDNPYSVATVREREHFRQGSPTLTGRRVAIGSLGGAEALCVAVLEAVTANGGVTHVLASEDGSRQAAEANAADVDVYLGFAVADDPEPICTTAYYRSANGWESTEGRRLAEAVQRLLPAVVGLADGGVRGMAVPVLRETKMPAVVIEMPDTVAAATRTSADLAGAVSMALQGWLAAPATA